MSSVQESVPALRERVRELEHRAEILEFPGVSRAELEGLRRELASRVGPHPPPDCPSVRGRPGPAGRSGAHGRPWERPGVVRGQVELERFLAPHGAEVSTVGAARLAGVDLALHYEQGVLRSALLREDGRSGLEVLGAVRALASVPLRLRPPGSTTESRVTKPSLHGLGPSTTTPTPPFPERLEVRGRVAIRNQDFALEDRARIDASDAPFVTPEGMIDASLRDPDARVGAARGLRFFAESVLGAPALETRWQTLGALKSWGFGVHPLVWRCRGLREVLDFVDALQRVVGSAEYTVVGGTLTLNAERAEGPRAVELGFPPLGRQAQVSRVYFAVGRSGSLLPVATLESLESEAPLPERAPVPAVEGGLLALADGLRVRVRAGPVAPVLTPAQVAVLAEGPSSCPRCQQEVAQRPGEVAGRCVNVSCPGRSRALLAHLLGPRGLGLERGVELVEGLVTRFGALDLPALLGLGAEAFDAVRAGTSTAFRERVEALSAGMPLWQALHLAGIPGVGERAARVAAQRLHSVRRVPAGGPDPDLLADIAPAAGVSLARWWAESGEVYFGALHRAGVEILDARQTFPAPFSGLEVVVEGSFARGLAQVLDRVERLGGRPRSRINRTTDLALVGDDADRCRNAAAVYGVPVVDRVVAERLLSLV